MAVFDYISQVDLSIVRYVRDAFSCDFFDTFMPIVTLIGEKGVLWIVITLLLLCFKKTRKTGFVMALSLLFGVLFGNLTLKPLVARERPCWVDNVSLLIANPTDYSFPSGHTLACFEGAVSLLLCSHKKTGTLAIISAFLVALSRVYLYVHFPTDVICGAILGTLFAFFAFYIVNKLYPKCEKCKKM